MKVIIINEDSAYLGDIIKLGNENSSTLGFLPRGAYLSYAARGQIIVVLGNDNSVIGYLLYNIKNRGMIVSISHLCVKQSHRRCGVGLSLVNELKKRTKDLYRGIRIHCRRDWEASKVWPKYGFTAKHEIPGRSRAGSTLTVWWFDHGHPDLFQLADEQRLKSKVKVVIDANVFFDLQDNIKATNKESLSLLADWLQEDIELCLTQEIYNEINRNPDCAERKRSRMFAESFVKVTSADDESQKVQQAMKRFFPSQLDEHDESDLRQLAIAIAANVQFFVTRDEHLLDRADEIYKCLNVQLMRPSDIVIQQDSLLRESEYQAYRLAGSFIESARVRSKQNTLLQNYFRAPQEETKGEFRDRLQYCLANPQSFQTEIVRGENTPIALISYNRQDKRILEIPLLRIAQGTLGPTLSRYLLLRAIANASKESRILTKVSDNYLSDGVIDALRENGFFCYNGTWIKANPHLIEQATEIARTLCTYGEHFPELKKYFHTISNLIHLAVSKKSTQVLLRVEKSIWSTKILDLDIPAFIVPIRPIWAMNLFDSKIARQDLFGSKPSLVFNVENVYYRSRRPEVIKAPARILWYVSKGEGGYQGIQSVKACSYIDEVIIDKPKSLFARFRRLGVYEWRDVFEVANNDLDREIMAFRFSNTELFDSPISLSDLRHIWIEESGRKFHLQTPRTISTRTFYRLYKLGNGII